MKKYLLTAEPPKSSSFLELIDYSIKNAVCHIFRSYRYVFDSLESYYLERGKIEEGSLTLIQVPDLVSDEGLILKKDLNQGRIILKDKTLREPISFEVIRGSGRRCLDEESWRIVRSLMPHEEVEIAFWHANIEGEYMLSLFRVYKKNDGGNPPPTDPQSPRNTGNTLEEVLEVLK